jgi:outer membrane receptor protein involved in Fe transport
MSAREIRESGRTSIGDAIRDLPQSFSGGQNPGVAGDGSQGNNSNINSSSTINLRGLGPDATLTLINGHRVAYDGNRQGVDVDQIPLAALDRIEIVADGASALYGSDAVGGVANILIKHDFHGAVASARWGAATDGGGEQQQYDLTTGGVWTSGGLMVALDYSDSDAVDAGQRSFTQGLGRKATLLPWQRQYGTVVAAHQSVGPFEFSIDGIYHHRNTLISFPTSAAGDVTQDGTLQRTGETSFSVTPKMATHLGQWTASLTATYAEDNTRGVNHAYSGGSLNTLGYFGYLNRMVGSEASAEGPLIALPGGDARLAVGGGYRDNRLSAPYRATINGVYQVFPTEGGSRSSYYGYGEVNLPFVSAANAMAGLRQLSFSAAVRYEDYPGISHLATPKLGAVYSPTPDLTLKATWGRSFKAPTLYQEHQDQQAVVFPAAILGAVNAPAGATAILYSGGNPDLKPERATTWSASADLHPRIVRGLTVSGSYFHINYRDRIINPITSIVGILTNPDYAALVQFAPSPTYLDEIVAATPGEFLTFPGATYNPANVYAVVDSRMRNVARQSIEGFDFDLHYEVHTAGAGILTFTAAASHLKSHQQLGPSLPVTTIAGTIFNPPHWRARGGLEWTNRTVTLSANVTYIGGVTDNRASPFYHVRGMAPVDIAATGHLGASSGIFQAVDLVLAVRNIQNAKPALIFNNSVYSPTYDSANYPALGRFVSFAISKAF